MTQSKPAWSVPIALSNIPEDGRRFDLVADDDTRAQVAQLVGLRSLPRLQATFDVVRQGSSGLRVDGEVSATVGQSCVVTLEPVDNEVKEEVTVVFVPSRQVAGGQDGEDDAEEIHPSDPEPLAGDAIDLGAVAVEFLILGIDPYPRKPGVKFEPPIAKDDTSHPFAALAALKKGPGGKE
jgi:uncharacterized metal-binding protein YceD (DUF177 family)